MNRGVEKRNKKRAKNNKKMRQMKPEQENICRFVTVNYINFGRVNGKMRKTGETTAEGLQIENRVYLADGHYKFINNKHLRIRQVYDGVPEDAPEGLIALYNSKIKA